MRNDMTVKQLMTMTYEIHRGHTASPSNAFGNSAKPAQGPGQQRRHTQRNTI